MSTTIRLIIIDDDPDFLDAYQALVLSEPGFECVGVATDGRSGVALWRDKRPDVVLMDLAMPSMPGVEAIRAICCEDPQARVVALTSLGDAAHVDAALVAGAVSYVMKGCDSAELFHAVGNAHGGRMLLSAGLRQTLINLLQANRVAPPTSLYEAMTPQESEVLRFLAQGLSNRRIAEKMVLSEAAIKAHLNHLYAKFRVTSRNHLLVTAVSLGLISSGSLRPSREK